MSEHTFESKRSHLVDRLGQVEGQVLSEFAAVLGVLMDTELNALAKSLVDLVKVLLVFCDLADEVERLLDKVLADDLGCSGMRSLQSSMMETQRS